MARKLLVIGFFLFLVVTESMASIVRFRTLEEVLTPDIQVIQAEIVASALEIEPNQLTVTVEVANITPLRVHGELGQTFVHRYSTILEREGKRVSPIRSGSGLEQRLEKGESYILLLDSSGESLIRVEALTSKAKVETILKTQNLQSEK